MKPVDIKSNTCIDSSKEIDNNSGNIKTGNIIKNIKY